MTTAFWLNNPSILLKQSDLFEIWPAPTMSMEQKLNAIQQARRNGSEDIAIEFFNLLAKSEKKLTEPKPPKPVTSQADTKTKTKSKPKKKIWPWLVIVLGLLSISVGVSAVLHPEFGEKIIGMFSAKTKNVKALQAEDLSAAAAKDPIGKTTDLPEVALQGQRWLMSLPEDHFVLEFQTFTNVQDAQNEIAGKEWLKRSYIVPVRAEGSSDVKFLIVDGPFRTAEIAKKAASRMPNSSDIVIENVAGLRGYASPQKVKP